MAGAACELDSEQTEFRVFWNARRFQQVVDAVMNCKNRILRNELGNTMN